MTLKTKREKVDVCIYNEMTSIRWEEYQSMEDSKSTRMNKNEFVIELCNYNRNYDALNRRKWLKKQGKIKSQKTPEKWKMKRNIIWRVNLTLTHLEPWKLGTLTEYKGIENNRTIGKCGTIFTRV